VTIYSISPKCSLPFLSSFISLNTHKFQGHRSAITFVSSRLVLSLFLSLLLLINFVVLGLVEFYRIQNHVMVTIRLIAMGSVIVNLTQLVRTMHNICKVRGSNLDHHKKKAIESVCCCYFALFCILCLDLGCDLV
jgi:hypothetical protein